MHIFLIRLFDEYDYETIFIKIKYKITARFILMPFVQSLTICNDLWQKKKKEVYKTIFETHYISYLFSIFINPYTK